MPGHDSTVLSGRHGVESEPLERIIREIRQRTRVAGAFPDGQSALMLVAARLRHIASSKWGKRRYMQMEPLLNSSKAGGGGVSRKLLPGLRPVRLRCAGSITTPCNLR
jgi:hypothetical protein